MTAIEDIYKRYVEIFLPNIVWMCVCFFVGVVGNSVVLLVYVFRMKSKTQEQYFIPVLAFYDLTASAVSSVHGLVDYLFYLNYPSNTLCKFLNFGSFFTSGISAHTLLLIAIQRYRKICKPHGKQMTLYWRRIALVMFTVFSLGYSFPIYFTAGIMNWEIKRHNVTLSIKSCAINSDNLPLFYKIFFSSIFSIVVLNILSISTLYLQMACTINKSSTRKRFRNGVVAGHEKEKNKHSNSPNKIPHNVQSAEKHQKWLHANTKVYLSNDSRRKSLEKCTDDDSNTSSLPDNSKNVKSKVISISYKTRDVSITDTPQPQVNKPDGRWNKAKVNFNKMFGAVVVFYLLSYLPTMVLFVGQSWGALNVLDRNVFEFLNRFYIANHIVNPFVYGYFDFNFRHSLKSCIQCWKKL